MAIEIDQIYEEIKDDIINLKLLPNTKVKEEDLAARFHISRTPVRTVIARLVQDGLLVVEPKKGTYISRINTNNITADRFVRKTVESRIINDYAINFTSEQLDELLTILNKQDEIAKMESSIEKSQMFYENDNEFHRKIFEFANMAGIWDAIYDYTLNLNRVRIIANMRVKTHVSKVYNQHAAIVNHIKNKEIDLAVKVFEEHLDSGFEGIDEVKTKFEDYFI